MLLHAAARRRGVQWAAIFREEVAHDLCLRGLG